MWEPSLRLAPLYGQHAAARPIRDLGMATVATSTSCDLAQPAPLPPYARVIPHDSAEHVHRAHTHRHTLPVAPRVDRLSLTVVTHQAAAARPAGVPRTGWQAMAAPTSRLCNASLLSALESTHTSRVRVAMVGDAAEDCGDGDGDASGLVEFSAAGVEVPLPLAGAGAPTLTLVAFKPRVPAIMSPGCAPGCSSVELSNTVTVTTALQARHRHTTA